LVPVSGTIKLEAHPVTSGRLILIPQGAGERAESLIDEHGAIRPRTKGIVGVKPGTYRITLMRPLSAEKNSPDRIGDLPPEEITVLYQSPADAPLAIAESSTTDLDINVEKKSGWTRRVTD
jgi:hypothetical protein